jgi:uncharacterized protein YraI
LVNTYVRTGPADTYPAYGIAKAGALALVIGKSEDGLWLTIRLDPKVVGKGYGWIALQYVEASDIENVPVVEEGAPPVVEAPPAPVEGAPSATAADYLNVRTGPGTNYPVVVVAPPGATGEVTGRSADNIWWQVKVSTQYVASGLGWVSQDYTYSSNTDAVPVVDAPPPPEYPANPAPGTCSLVSQTPADGSTAVAGSTFTTTWELQNTSDETWIAANNDIRYYASIDNINLYTGSALYDVQEDVAPNGTIVVSIPMIAPDAPGSYGDLWGISAGEDNPPVCQFWVTINVQ